MKRFLPYCKIIDEKVCWRRGYTEYVGALFQQMVLEIKRIANRTKYPDVVARIAHYIQSTYHENIEIISSKDIYIDFGGNLLYNGRHQER